MKNRVVALSIQNTQGPQIPVLVLRKERKKPKAKMHSKITSMLPSW
jgi:hypothetical protein